MLRGGRRTVAPLCLGRDGEEVLNETRWKKDKYLEPLMLLEGLLGNILESEDDFLLATEIIPSFVLSFTKHVYIHYLICFSQFRIIHSFIHSTNQ